LVAGSGKSILRYVAAQLFHPRQLISLSSSSIIHDTKRVSNITASCVVYFFFDFKDESKQDSRALLSSLLIQLSDQSDSCFKVLFDLYSSHKRGEEQPSEDSLLQCLKVMILGSGEVPIYIIVDALDECPDISKKTGVPRPRRKALQIVKELVQLQHSNLHLCLTSRPEADIRNVLEPLACFKISLHDEDGQKEDIAEYVRSVVYSDEEQEMNRWRSEVKELVINTLSEKADGMYVCSSILIPLAETITQVSLGGLSTGNTAAVFCTQCPACAQRIARVSR
jgi:hypothetical protein